MLFSSLLFIYIFLPALLICYFTVRRNSQRRAVLLLFSLVFYAWGEPVYIILMIGLVFVNYIFGLLINKTESLRERRLLLILAVIVDLCPLFFFKYLSFMTGIINGLFPVEISVPGVALPLGISFFTFQAMSYIFDLYRGTAECQKSFARLLLYISFFPQLVAGPIVRYADIEKQLEDRKMNIEDINEGLFRFTAGLLKKVLIANTCGRAADAILGADLNRTSVFGSWIGILFYAMQIYYDFSGYSDMAIGLGRIFGFRFKENFNYPYISRNVTEFWRRWHISLGSFFRDYVYIPIGGNRRYWARNAFIVWSLTGLWHGASWNFVIWGVYYGILLIAEKALLLRLFARLPGIISAVVSYVYMAAVTLFGWTLFYFSDNIIGGTGRFLGIGVQASEIFSIALLRDNAVILIVAAVFAAPVVPALSCRMKKILPENRYVIASRVAKTAFTAAGIALGTMLLAGSSYNPFLYFRF
ncbi:MAG: MBOAT family protein [Eubacteriales bacterium]|nr:MBOAT family protein [Eubacteriales bacterium]